MGEGLLEALLPNEGPRPGHGRGGDVLQGGSRGEGGISETEQTHGVERDGYNREDIGVRDNTRDTGTGEDLEMLRVHTRPC